MITIQHLSQAFGKKIILDDVSLQINSHEICALVGRNGAGKSTLINSLLGLLHYRIGKITINNIDLKSRNKSWKKDIAYLPEKFMLYPSLTGLENMVFFAEATEGKAYMARIQEILNSVHLWEERDTLVKQYSKGMLQRLGLAITLFSNAGMLILDEPTSGIDPLGRKEILEILNSLKNKTILLSSHHLDEIKQVCTHVAYLNNGKIEKYTVEQFLQTQSLGVTES